MRSGSRITLECGAQIPLAIDVMPVDGSDNSPGSSIDATLGEAVTRRAVHTACELDGVRRARESAADAFLSFWTFGLAVAIVNCRTHQRQRTGKARDEIP
jgi:hypothetical protein